MRLDYLSYLKMVSAFVDIDDAVPHFSSSAASQKAKFSPDVHTPYTTLDPNKYDSFLTYGVVIVRVQQNHGGSTPNVQG